VVLLGRMNIPKLRVDQIARSVQTLSGDNVSIFIDYLPATENDITGMRLKDVRRVEVYDYPTDVRFRGAEHVVNFVMQKYEYGGYVKLFNQMYAEEHEFVERPTLSSKVSYKRMTYDASVGGNVADGTFLESEQLAKFRFPGLDEITRSVTSSKLGRLNYYTAFGSLRATYNTEKTSIANTVGYNYTKQPHFDDHGELSFTGINLPGSQTSNIVNRLWRTAAWNGDYYFVLPHDFTLSLSPQAQYSYSLRDARYMVDQEDQIHNKADSKTYYANFNGRVNKKVNSKVTLFANLQGLYQRNSVKYAGSNPGNVILDSYSLVPEVGIVYSKDKFRLNGDVGYAFEWHDADVSGGRMVSYPNVQLSTQYTFSDKLSLQTWTRFSSTFPGAAERSPVMQQQNELLWSAGNPDVSNSNHFTQQVSASWFPTNRFQMSGYVRYYHKFNNLVRTYTPSFSETGEPRMLSYLFNDGVYNSTEGGLYATVNFLDNNLIFTGGARLAYYYLTGSKNEVSIKKPYASWNLLANYYLKQFNFTAYYYSSSNSVQDQDGAECWTNDSYAIGAGWGNNNIAVQLYLTNFLSKDRTYTRTTLNTLYYSSESTLANGNHVPTVYFTLTYTFGFGKKIERGNEVHAVSAVSDGILK
ncbi:MAG: hypothetical protein K2O10_03820, partial [Muribaculaceae bacterium]|nr:hypothetical protein [Muribaculaceae bacterium]